jgi:hypothetical protein
MHRKRKIYFFYIHATPFKLKNAFLSLIYEIVEEHFKKFVANRGFCWIFLTTLAQIL